MPHQEGKGWSWSGQHLDEDPTVRIASRQSVSRRNIRPGQMAR